MNDIYKLIKSLRMEDQFPNEVFHNSNQFIGPSEIAQEFNTFFIRQFTPCDRQYRDFPPSVLNEIEFSLEEIIETFLQTSDGMGSDNMSGATTRTIATPLSIHFLNLARSILESILKSHQSTSWLREIFCSQLNWTHNCSSKFSSNSIPKWTIFTNLSNLYGWKISSRMKCFITVTSLLDLRKLRRNSILSS